MKYSIIGSGIVGNAIYHQQPDSVLYTRHNLTSEKKHNTLVIAAPTGNRVVVNSYPEKDLENCNLIINFINQSNYNHLVYISTIDVYKNNSHYATNRHYLETSLAKLPNSHIIRLPSLIDFSVNKNILYDLKSNIWLDKICLDSEIQWYPLKRLSKDIEYVIESNIKTQNLFSAPIQNRAIVKKFFPNLINQLNTNVLTPVKYDIKTNKSYAISSEEIWRSFEDFFVDSFK